MSKTTRETLYPSTRLSAKLSSRGVGDDGTVPNRSDRVLIEALRSAREEGYDAIMATERYDPDFSIDLSRARTEAEADVLLEHWHDRRCGVLATTRATLKRIWQEHQRKSTSEPGT
ncbi:hypothetical protein MKK63_16280 [Methylobacterium sp. J-088]|uniref:hypothetical protein n=1 Tax=Methylobacterium sp. J-088 TaxID=2836664 RepID=UPI001FBAA206|nr:hypothetical protein [Methylobacterium sp. J-088]MCJ2064261.1 hypothetical protein [Methylobacterium sp. J-088]